MRGLLLGAFLASLLTAGALADPYLASEVPFSAIEREHFDAIGVVREHGRAADSLLVVRVSILGDGADADLAEPTGWLREHAGIELVRDARGVPLFLTRGDLAATSGRGTLGATVSEGMAVEVRDMRVGRCVVAHEVLHFVGLRHTEARDNIMYPRCSKDMLDRATIEPDQLAAIREVEAIRATTPSGVVLWAHR